MRVVDSYEAFALDHARSLRSVTNPDYHSPYFRDFIEFAKAFAGGYAVAWVLSTIVGWLL
jgi:hypothetical protein